MTMTWSLATYEESNAAVERGNPTPLEAFIHAYEPSLCDRNFRGMLTDAILSSPKTEELLDVSAICDQRDKLLGFLIVAEGLLDTAPIHHHGKQYEAWRDARTRFRNARTVEPLGIGAALSLLKAAIHYDSEYAWSWHCNLAMPMIDAGIDGGLANDAAARLMQYLFEFDSRTCKEWGTHRGAQSERGEP